MAAADIRIPVSGARIAGRYRLDDRIHDTVPAGSAQGSQLWKATDEILARAVVVRTLPPGFTRTGEVLAAARAASRLSDPRLARIFDAYDGDDGAYIITEWPPGNHLDDLLAAGPLSCGRATALITAAAGALTAAHAAGVAHLCLTPRSLLWNPTTGAKIIGLGVDAALAGVTADDPELADARGLASLFYAALTARWPGQDGHPLPPAPQRTGQVSPPRQVRAGVPKHLHMVVRRALFEQTPRDHPPIVTPAQMANALAAGTRARVPPADDLTAAARPPTELAGRAIRPASRHPRSVAAAGQPPRRSPRRQPAGSSLLLSAAGLVTLLLSASLWMVEGRSEHATTCLPAPVPGQERPVVAASVLTPADVRSFDPDGADDGRATLATDHNVDTTWHSHWYTTARFGNLATGTGLMVDIGSQAMITHVRIAFGATPGADVELRVGNSTDSLNSLRIVARVSPAVGVMEIPVTPAAVGRYLLIWFTRLPPQDDGSGTFQATVREVTTNGIR
jgi:hypothetical protein